MDLLIFALIVLIVTALVVYAVRLLPIPSPFNTLIQALIVLIAALVIVRGAGLV